MSTLEHSGAVTVERTVDASPEDVWRVLADGWSYAQWVVGASRVRAVDPAWPAPGATIHHSFGMWPVMINDRTEVLQSEPPVGLVLRARGWPLGEAKVVLTIRGEGPGRSTIRIAEDATAGPGQLAPKPLRQAMIAPRNVETLRRLALLSERRTRP